MIITGAPLTIFGEPETAVLDQMANCQAAEEGSRGVLCGDAHLGYSMPIGGVVAYRELVSPSAVGYDIACGNCAVRTDLQASVVDVPRVMDQLWKVLSFGIGRKNQDKVESPVLDEIAECLHPLQRGLIDTAAAQLGTIGSGNHYVDLFKDETDGYLWVGVHFGSRGFGHKTATWALEQAGGKDDSMMAPPVTIRFASDLGMLYLDGMERAGRYAYAGRDWVVDRVLRILGAQAVERIHNHHNFAWFETHNGESMLVHRKGATPAFPGQKGFVGASMGDSAVILEGVDDGRSKLALYSTVHGAGRVLSRTKAAGKVKRVKSWQCGNRDCHEHGKGWPMQMFTRGKDASLPPCPACGGKMRPFTRMLQVSPGLIDFESVQREIAAKGIELRGAGADEAPGCYKVLGEVLADHAGTVRILNSLKPIGVAMAGKDTVDPFKD